MEVPKAYDYLHKMITQGFISLGFSIDEHYFVFKTVTDRESEQISFYSDPKDLTKTSILKVSMATVAINGKSYLEDRSQAIRDLEKFYRQVPSILMSKIYESVNTLQDEILEATEFFEGFCYTDHSKALWRVFSSGVTSESYTGIKGLECIGLNAIKEAWISLNRVLDSEESYYEKLKLALLIASSMSPKGGKDLLNKVEAQRVSIEEQRNELAKYGHFKKKREKNKKEQWTAPLDTKEDLVRALHNQVTGKKDKHDLFIDEYLRKVKEDIDRKKEESLKKSLAYRKSLDETLLDTEGSRQVTEEEMASLNKKRAKTVAFVEDPEKMTHEKTEKYLTKISPRVLKAQ
jgi:hypothetical protein